MLSKFAELVLKIGVNIQDGQGLEIACPTEKADVAVALTKKAYELGARIVRVRWENDEIEKLNYLCATTEALTDIPKWFVDSKNYLLEKGFCYVAISAEDPSVFKDIPAEKLSAVVKARSQKLLQVRNKRNYPLRLPPHRRIPHLTCQESPRPIGLFR